MTNLTESFGGGGYANGFNSASPEPNLFTVALAAGQGVLAPFTVLGKTEDGVYIVYGSDEDVTAPAAILAKETDTGTDDTADAVISAGYRFGAFNRNHLILADDYEWTDADEDAMRDLGYALNDSLN